jgi:hypothetical protein
VPAPFVTALLAFAAILTALNPLAAGIVALVAVLLELLVFILAGSGSSDGLG